MYQYSSITNCVEMMGLIGMGNEARFKEFIENEFKQYEWFYKDGRWRNDRIDFVSG